MLFCRLAVPVMGPDPDSDLTDPSSVPTLAAPFRMFVTLRELPRLPVLDFMVHGMHGFWLMRKPPPHHSFNGRSYLINYI